jgi:hypothetical protein
MRHAIIRGRAFGWMGVFCVDNTESGLIRLEPVVRDVVIYGQKRERPSNVSTASLFFDNSIRKQPIRRREYGQAERPISTGQLNTLLCVHLPPINLVVYEGPSGRPHLGGGFPLRCFQRLSLPHMATERCRWRDNSYTRGASIPVLSYWGQLPSSLLRPRQIGTELSHDVLNPARGPL